MLCLLSSRRWSIFVVEWRNVWMHGVSVEDLRLILMWLETLTIASNRFVGMVCQCRSRRSKIAFAHVPALVKLGRVSAVQLFWSSPQVGGSLLLPVTRCRFRIPRWPQRVSIMQPLWRLLRDSFKVRRECSHLCDLLLLLLSRQCGDQWPQISSSYTKNLWSSWKLSK